MNRNTSIYTYADYAQIPWIGVLLSGRTPS